MNTSNTRTIAAFVAGTLVAAAAATAVARPAEAATYVKNPIFAKGTTHWTPSAHATKTRVKVTIAGKNKHAGQVKPKKNKTNKARTVRLTSSLSPSHIPTAGTQVRTTARVRASRPGKTVTYRVTELYGGKAVSSRSTRVRSTGGWFFISTALTTKSSRTHLRVSIQMDNAKPREHLRITDVTTTVKAPKVTLPEVAPPKPSPTTKPPKPAPSTPTTTGPTTPAPTAPAPTPPAPTPNPPAAATKCEDIDYKDPKQGTLTYADEFNGTKLDSKKWRVRDNTSLNQDAAYIDKKNVSVHDGYLDIMGQREPQANWRNNPNPLYGDENRVRKYSTGYIDSIKKKTYESPDAASNERFSQKYGHFEARMWVPSEATMSRGIWPAFWLRADNQPGEIDPMESYGGPTIRSFDPSSSYEWNSWGNTAEGSMSGIVKQQTHGRADVGNDKIWQGWHTYGVNWSPNCLRYLYDGKTVGIVDFNDPNTKTYFKGPTFDDKFHIRFNMQIGSKYWGWPDQQHTRDKFHFKIDYVRVYQGHGLPR